VAAVADLPPGSRKIVTVAGPSIGVFNINGEFRAVLNICPHELAPVCRGHLRGTTLPSAPGEFVWGRTGEILACPWHGWEFDLRTGECLVDKRRLRLFPVEVEDNTVYVLLRANLYS
jgi:3-phenylpropionate/trans-cinnamate dioxygenase ferredoxin subunit